MLAGCGSKSTVEAGPVEVKENCTSHSNQLRVVAAHAFLVRVFFCFLWLIEKSCSKTEICTKCMNSHRATNVDCFKALENDGFIQGVEDHLHTD